MPKLESPGLFTVGVKVPRGVICLQSALEFHKLIHQQQTEISVALVKGSERPQIQDLHLKFYLISEPAFSAGIEVHLKDGINVQIYSPEKTLVDCFKFRKKIGLDICLQALQTWWRSENKKTQQLSELSKICRMENVIRPYLELLTVQGSNTFSC
jgi:predicted transcriptional regulator of viral defense system